MRCRIKVCFSVVFLFVVFGDGSRAFAQVGVNPQDIPSGFDFPANEQTLLEIRDTENVTKMREHAWNVWAGLTQPATGGEAIWETWYSGKETFDPASTLQGAADRVVQRNFQTPRQSDATTGASPQAAGASLLSFTLFSKATRTHIRGNGLNTKASLTSANNAFTNATPIEDRKVMDFPREAISLKIVWWPVMGDKLTAAPVWDFKPENPPEDGNDFDTWERFVAIDAQRTVIPSDETADVVFRGVSKPDSHVVPLSSFYHFKIETPEQLQALTDSRRTREAVRMSFGATRSPKLGDYLVMVCFHYTTKEIPDWVWTTLWWHDKPNDGPYAMDRLSSVTGVWRNYLMDTNLSMDTPREFDGTPNVNYNPWLEARFKGSPTDPSANGLTSNCMTCHQRAVWPPVGFTPITRGAAQANDPIFTNSMKTDFLWSIIFESFPQP